MRKYFEATAEYNGENWLVAWFGNDGKRDWNLQTRRVHASELYTITKGADGDCQLVADLLNWYHNTPEAEEIIAEFAKELEE